MRHRELDLSGADSLGTPLRLAAERGSPIQPPCDLDLAPGEAHARPERLADGLLAGEAGRVVLRRVRLRVAVRPLGIGEAALAEGRVALEGPCDPRDLDQVDADSHRHEAYVAV